MGDFCWRLGNAVMGAGCACACVFAAIISIPGRFTPLGEVFFEGAKLAFNGMLTFFERAFGDAAPTPASRSLPRTPPRGVRAMQSPPRTPHISAPASIRTPMSPEPNMDQDPSVSTPLRSPRSYPAPDEKEYVDQNMLGPESLPPPAFSSGRNPPPEEYKIQKWTEECRNEGWVTSDEKTGSRAAEAKVPREIVYTKKGSDEQPEVSFKLDSVTGIFTTQDKTVNTFVKMLEGFKKVHGDDMEPAIMARDKESAREWKAAIEIAYHPRVFTAQELNEIVQTPQPLAEPASSARRTSRPS